MLNFRSDTFSLPSHGIRAALAEADVGDDYYGEDPSVTRLESYCCELFDKEAAVFTTTGMLANQLAVSVHVDRGNELVTEYGYHLHLYESAQHAAFSHVVLNARSTADGVLRATDVDTAIRSKPRDPAYSQVQMVSVENSMGNRAGRVFPFEELRKLRRFTNERGIRVHLDGARLFNAHIYTGIPLAQYAREADTVSVCFSKALGAPLGSMLLGPRESIEQARRLRVWHGSGFHQAGFCAAAAYYALTRQMERLAEDHRLTQLLAVSLERYGGFGVTASQVETNMVFLDVSRWTADATEFQDECRRRGLLVSIFPPGMIRLVVCRNVDEPEVRQAAAILAEAADSLSGKTDAPSLVEQPEC